MIIGIVALGAIATFMSLMMVTRFWPRLVATLVSLVVLVGSVVLIVKNSTDHWGMVSRTTQHRQEIYSISGAGHVSGQMVVEPVGSAGQEHAYAYHTADNATKITTDTPELNKTSRVTAIDGTKAYREVSETSYVYQDDWMRWLFGVADNNHEVTETRVTYQLPSTWLTLTKTQSEKLQAVGQKQSAAAKQQQAQQAAQLQALAKQDPKAAAQKEIAGIKALLAN